MSSSGTPFSTAASTRARLQALRDRRQSSGTSRSLFASPPPSKGGGVTGPADSNSPNCVFVGEEVFYVHDANRVCLGRVGTGDKVCLKVAESCEVFSHVKNKPELPQKSFMGLKSSSDEVGHTSLILDTGNFDQSFISHLLEKTDMDWASEFGKIRANEVTSLSESSQANDFIDTVKKHRSFAKTPSKVKVESMYDESMRDFDQVTSGLESLLERTLDRDVINFSGESYMKTVLAILDQLDAFYEFALLVENVLGGEIHRIQGHVGPIEEVVNGMRLKLAALAESLGSRESGDADLPPIVWKALESSFSSLSRLEDKIAKAMEIAEEAKEISLTLLESEEGRMKDVDEGNPIKASSPFLDRLNPDKPYMSDGILHPPRKTRFANHGKDPNDPNQSGPPPSDEPNGVNCCTANGGVCVFCTQKFIELEAKLTAVEIRLANLESAKSGNVESAILVRHKIFRGRPDIIGWLDQAFPHDGKGGIEAACFATPHMIFNLVSADMCGLLAYPKLDLRESDLSKLHIKRSDAISFYALLQDRPDFMISNSTCPMHTYKSTKADRDKPPIKFVPTYADFGMSSDPDTLHYKFKTSLQLIRERQESYIESRLGHHTSRFVYDVSKQLLNDSIRFVSELLSFMEEVYSQCIQSFDATVEAWALVCHCIEEIFTKELKPSLKYLVANDLVEPRLAYYGVVHSAFSLNSKVRELLSTGISNHNSSSKSHVRFIMKMSRKNQTSSKETDWESKYKTLESNYTDLKKDMESSKGKLKSLESTLQKLVNKAQKKESNSTQDKS